MGLVIVNHLEGGGGNVGGCDAKVLVDLVGRGRHAKGVHTDGGVGVSGPSHGDTSLDTEDGDAVGEDGETVLRVLLVKELPTGHTDETDGLALEDGLVEGLETDLDFTSGRNDDDLGLGGDDRGRRRGRGVRRGLKGVEEDVGATGDEVDRGRGDLGKVLAGEGEDSGTGLLLDGDGVGTSGLVTVSRTEEKEVGGGSAEEELLDRLVSGTVLTETDTVVGHDKESTVVGEGTDGDRAKTVTDKVQESGSVWKETTIGSNAVDDGSHGVLADTKAKVASVVRVLLEVRGSVEDRLVGASKISTATDELGHDRVESLEDFPAGGTGGLGLVALVDGELVLPSLRETVLKATLDLRGELGVRVLVLGVEGVPGSLLLLTSLLALEVDRADVLGDKELLGGVETELLLDLGNVIVTKGSSVDLLSVLVL